MTVWTATYYLPLDGRGNDILDELDQQMGVAKGSNVAEGGRAYFEVNLCGEEIDKLVQDIDPECWEHLRRLEES